jgi:hypothetical protein
MAGRLVRDGGDLCFVPRYAFLDGTAYTVAVDGGSAAVLGRARPGRAPSTRVTAICPTAAEVPSNLLRLYVRFSAPMSEGCAAEQVRLAGDDGSVLAGSLLPAEHELWDASHRRLTVLLDPARIKRGLAGHQEAGYPLRWGDAFRLIVGSGFLDAQGLPLRVSFDRPLDHGLLARCLQVSGPGGQVVDGTPRIGHGEQSWQLVPRQPWAPAAYQLIVDSVLEDVAGNSVSRVFDRDLARPDDRPRRARPVIVGFRPS